MTANRSDQQQSRQDPERAFTSGKATEAGINPGLPGRDELQHWWTRWWGHCLPHKDFLSSYRDPPSLSGQALASSKTKPLCGAARPKRKKERNQVMVERLRKDERSNIAIFFKKAFYVSFNLNGFFCIVFLACLFHKQECQVLTSVALLSDGGTQHQILPHCQQ